MFFPKPEQPEKMSTFLLAYIGDAVYELYIRQALLAEGITKSKEMHRKAVRYVNAGTQARLLKALETRLTEEEAAVVRRGRNAKTGHVPKNVDMIVYRYSTALEALVGYLYLKEDKERLEEILRFLLDGGFAHGDKQEFAEKVEDYRVDEGQTD